MYLTVDQYNIMSTQVVLDSDVKKPAIDFKSLDGDTMSPKTEIGLCQYSAR